MLVAVAMCCKIAHSLARVSHRPMLYTILRVMMNRRMIYTREQAVVMEKVRGQAVGAAKIGRPRWC